MSSFPGSVRDVAEFSDDPFPHVIVRGGWETPLLQRAVDSWPANGAGWKHYKDHKQGHMDWSVWPWSIREVVNRGVWDDFRDLLAEKVVPDVSSEDLIWDHTMFGAGLHQVNPGGKLGMHVDFNTTKTAEGKTIYRRANVLLFLNKGWKRSQGGTLFLGKDRSVAIDPTMNTMVMMPCTEDSWHGHPDPVCGDTPRRSIAWYWYSRTPPAWFKNEHSTIYERDA